MEELEETQMNLQAMLTMRHVTPFRERAQELLQALSETSDTLERWVKVQMLWCSLESVFTGGDIARQMPMEAKKFAKIDKEWTKVMSRAFDTQLVVECAANEILRAVSTCDVWLFVCLCVCFVMFAQFVIACYNSHYKLFMITSHIMRCVFFSIVINCNHPTKS